MPATLFALSAFLLWAPQQPIEFEKAFVGAVETNRAYWRRPVEVCGDVYQRPEVDGKTMMTLMTGSSLRDHSSRRDHFAIIVDSKAGLIPGRRACVRGVYARKDGLSEAEAGAQRRFNWVVDGLKTDYILYPCSDAATCQKALGSQPLRGVSTGGCSRSFQDVARTADPR